MRIHFLLCGLLTVASPAFAQSASTPTTGGTGNYNLSGSYGGTNPGVSVLGNSGGAGMNLGGSSLGNGNLGTSYGSGNLSAGSGISIDSRGFSDGMSSLPAAGGSPSRPVPTTQGY